MTFPVKILTRINIQYEYYVAGSMCQPRDVYEKAKAILPPWQNHYKLTDTDYIA